MVYTYKNMMILADEYGNMCFIACDGVSERNVVDELKVPFSDDELFEKIVNTFEKCNTKNARDGVPFETYIGKKGLKAYKGIKNVSLFWQFGKNIGIDAMKKLRGAYNFESINRIIVTENPEISELANAIRESIKISICDPKESDNDNFNGLDLTAIKEKEEKKQKVKILEDVKEASNWITTALQSSGYRVNFSIKSLYEIERFFSENSQDGKAIPGGLLSEDLGPRLFAIGCYVGEVIRRAKKGKWEGNDKDPEAELNVAVKFENKICWPVQKIMKRYKNGKEDSIIAYVSGLGIEI